MANQLRPIELRGEYNVVILLFPYDEDHDANLMFGKLQELSFLQKMLWLLADLCQVLCWL